MKKLRLLLITLCVSVLMGSMAVTAYAGGGEEWGGLAPVEPLPAETVDPGEGFTEDGNLVTRDLLYDILPSMRRNWPTTGLQRRRWPSCWAARSSPKWTY